MIVIPSQEEHVRAVVINIEKPYKAFVMDEVYTSRDFLKEALEGYEDTEKYKIVIIQNSTPGRVLSLKKRK